MAQGLTIYEILPSALDETYRVIQDVVSTNLRVCLPGVVQSFDAQTQTVTVQLAVQERIVGPNLNFRWADIPLLLDVPIVVPRAGGFSLTLPVQPGDECLVVFADACVDGWYENGGVHNTQPDKRRHDLSDGFAILGPWSQPRVLPNYDTSAAQLRSDDGTVCVSVSADGISLTAPPGTITANGNVLG